MLKEDNVREGFVNDKEYAALARETGEIGLWMRTLFELGYSYGWRKSELLGLKVSQIDLMERTIVLYAGRTKNDEGRSARLTAAACNLLAVLISGKSPDDKVFTRLSKRGKVRPIAGFRKAWAKATEAAGCPGRLFHDLRRTGVRNLVRAGVGENLAMKITGHRTRSVFDRYDIVNEADKDRAIEMLEKDKAEREKRQQYEQAELPLEPPRKPAASDHLESRVVNSVRKPS
jgi:integrase